MQQSSVGPAITLDEAITFVWYEADLLDHGLYDEWLTLWAPGGRYVVPIEPGETDFENTLNYAFDDHALRSKRVTRLVSGVSVSASPVARTIRTQSRFRVLETGPEECRLRAAQSITEFRRGRERTYSANVEFQLRRIEDRLQIAQKVIRLINATDPLTGIGYIL